MQSLPLKVWPSSWNLWKDIESSIPESNRYFCCRGRNRIVWGCWDDSCRSVALSTRKLDQPYQPLLFLFCSSLLERISCGCFSILPGRHCQIDRFLIFCPTWICLCWALIQVLSLSSFSSLSSPTILVCSHPFFCAWWSDWLTWSKVETPKKKSIPISNF